MIFKNKNVLRTILGKIKKSRNILKNLLIFFSERDAYVIVVTCFPHVHDTKKEKKFSCDDEERSTLVTNSDK